MILYANQFPVDPSFTKERFVRQVIDWKQGARYDTFRNLEWDGIHYRLSWKEEKKLLSIEDFPEFGAVSAEFRKEDEYGVWITEFTLNYAEHYLSCRLRREVTEYTSDFNPQARPPVFGKLVIRDGYGGKDDILQVTPDVIPLGEEKLSLLRHMAAREMELMLPVVIVTRMEDGKLPLDSTELAKELQGIGSYTGRGADRASVGNRLRGGAGERSGPDSGLLPESGHADPFLQSFRRPRGGRGAADTADL